MRQDSLGDPESDPWASPAMTKPLAPPAPASAPQTNGHTENGLASSARNISQRTTSAFTTHSGPPSTGNSGAGEGAQPTGGEGDWNSYNGGSAGGFSEQPTLGGGFGDGGDDQGNRSSGSQARSSGPSAALPAGAGEVITITMLPEKEGMFMFQHRNYEVKSIRRGTSVVRRYSDFVWLVDCLHKRYPFRRLPLLPPKRVAGMYKQETPSASMLTSDTKLTGLISQPTLRPSWKNAAEASSASPIPSFNILSSAKNNSL
jgi:sorting nexin-8